MVWYKTTPQSHEKDLRNAHSSCFDITEMDDQLFNVGIDFEDLIEAYLADDDFESIDFSDFDFDFNLCESTVPVDTINVLNYEQPLINNI